MDSDGSLLKIANFHYICLMEKLWSRLGLVLKGMAMGVAEVIPGVSGGTIAFITGIYEELIHTIKNILSPGLVGSLSRGGLRSVWDYSNGSFLFFLLVGMGAGVVAGVFGVSHLLENYPELLWAFFFGLIVASAVYIGRQVGRWRFTEVLALVIGAIVAYVITIATPSQGNPALWFVFLSGAIAISALILPGISGSFILLLMGMYTFIIPSVKSALETQDAQSLIVVFVFALGCLLGLATFSRVLSWTFRHYHDPTLAVLTGFMLGSLNKIWPWRNVVSYRTDSKGETVPFLEKSVLPGQYEGDPQVLAVIVLMIVGFVAVFLIDWLGRRKPPLPVEEEGV